jgi:hypothetical protein
MILTEETKKNLRPARKTRDFSEPLGFTIWLGGPAISPAALELNPTVNGRE